MLRNSLQAVRRSFRSYGKNVASRNFHPLAAAARSSNSSSPEWSEPNAYNYVPVVIEQSGRGERSFDIFSRLLRERVVMLYGPIRDSVSAVTVSQLLFLEAEDASKPIHMYINSPGGSVTAGLAIYDTLDTGLDLKCDDIIAQYVSSPIHTYCIGQACSMGSLLLAAGEKDRRHCLPHASIMIHQPSGGASGQASDIAIHAREILRVREVLTSIYQRHCSREGESVKEGMERFEKALERDYFLTSKEALEFGLVDSILERRPKAEIEGHVFLVKTCWARAGYSTPLLSCSLWLPPPKSLYSRTSSPFFSSPSLYYSDSFRLTISAFDDVFHLHLRPNDHLVHSAARINYYKNGPGGRQILDRTVPLLRESVRAYWGEVIAARHSPERMREDAAGVLPRPSRKPDKELGWARILVHSQGDAERGIAPIYEGAFEVEGVTYHIQTRDNYLRNKQFLDPVLVEGGDNPDARLVVWRDSDVLKFGEVQSGTHGCEHDALDFNADPWLNPILRKPVPRPSWYDPLGLLNEANPWVNSSKVKRDDVQGGGTSSNNFENSIGSTAGCPQTQKVVYMGVAADCEYVAAYSSTQNATMQILNNWNTASSLYKSTFNISLGILQINVQDPTCPTSAPDDAPWNVPCSNTNVTLNDRLSLFSEWRGSQGDDGTGLWHLMSGCPTGSEVGVAWLGTLCQQEVTGSPGSSVNGVAVTTNGRTEWEVVSHEIGHNFGAIHDCQDGCGTSNNSVVCCPMSTSTCNANDAFIMSPVTSSSQKIFSQCTIGNICSLMSSSAAGHVNSSCIVDPDPSRKILSLNMCGNGIVESGEDCDPGQNGTSSCCDSSTCKFTSGAVCDPSSSSCCTNSCQFAPSTQVCRPAADPSCDIAETCTGNSSSCPTDIFQPNGKSCGSDELSCANGVCTSLNLRFFSAMPGRGLVIKPDHRLLQAKYLMPSIMSGSNEFKSMRSVAVPGSMFNYQFSQVMEAHVYLGLAWYVQNLQISVPVTVVVAIIILLLLWTLYMCIRRSRASTRAQTSAGMRVVRIPSWQPPLPPTDTRPAPSIPVTTRPTLNQPQTALTNIQPRRSSIPSSLQPGGSNFKSPTPVYTGFGTNPPVSPRNQSWDGVYARPTSSSARIPSRSRPGSGHSGISSRAREPVFPPAARNLSSLQSRPRNEPGWVDPTLWNGPSIRY
ncbi:hypothetical protein EW145_g2035 [Phellinidium pouzarii]|uniref:ATP-dependent Clp protease proteolytic subunit n=1 Tax=Phellinidium pouzarii TaxID=167371 RepID=A0A4V3XDF0_9AGAM|nr:hypothetical protein EW145_g2035 [Phellinidium pouzarii]